MTSEVPVPIPVMEDQAPASAQERNGKDGVQDQGREPQVEVRLEPQETAGKTEWVQNKVWTSSQRAITISRLQEVLRQKLDSIFSS